MSMYESAEKINVELEKIFKTFDSENITAIQKEKILNLMIRFGSVAKFRCRSNVAYDNFSNACFKNIATVERIHLNDDSDFKILKATIIEEKIEVKASEKVVAQTDAGPIREVEIDDSLADTCFTDAW